MHAGQSTLYSQEWKHANKFNITHWEQGIRLGSPTWTSFIRQQRVLSPHGGRHYSFKNCMRDGNSIKVRSGHKLINHSKFRGKAHMLEVGYFQHPSPHCLGSLRDIQQKHACWTPRLYSQAWKLANHFDFTHWEQGIKLRSPTWTAFIRQQRVLSPHGGCYYCQTCCKMFASKWVESNNLQERVYCSNSHNLEV